MDLQLNGKRALVTGSTVGIGFAIAKALAEEGVQVVVNGRTEERVSEAQRRIATEISNARIGGVAADLSAPDGVTKVIEAFPEIDILVNNLGIFEPRVFEQISDADWFRFFEVNVMSGVRLSRHYLPQMKDRNWGRIVFISSESAANIPADESMILRSGNRSSRRGSMSAAAIEPPPKKASASATSPSVPPNVPFTRTTVLTNTIDPAAATARLSASKPRKRGVGRTSANTSVGLGDSTGRSTGRKTGL